MNSEKLKTLPSLASDNDSESISNTTKPTYSLVEDCRLSSEKRKTSTSCESPRKRQKGCGSNTDASEPTEVAVDDVTAKGTKRKASAETETPKEKIQRVEDDDTDTKGSVEKEKSEKKASCEQLPATERKEDSLSSSDPSSSEQEEGSRSTSVASSTESISNTTKPTYSLVEDCRLSSEKRKTSTSCESPRKRQKGCGSNTDASEPTEVAVDDVTAKGTKRKASAETETPKEKIQRVKDDDTDTKGSVEKEKSEKKASCEQLPATERKEDSLSSSDPSTSEQEEGSRSTSVASSTATESGAAASDLSLITDDVGQAAFENKYQRLDIIEKGGFGAVYAGYRKADNLPVAIKRILKAKVQKQPVVINGKMYHVPKEVILMLRAGGGPLSVGKSAAVSILNWYDLEEVVLLVMERPVPAVDLFTYLQNNDSNLPEDTVKNIMKQLVDAAVKMHAVRVFHRDIKPENILVETGSDVPRVRIIDFGCGCFVNGGHYYHRYFGTTAFAPPEVYSTKRYMAGPTTVWQLGAVLFELLNECEYFNTPKFISKKLKINRDVSQDCQDFLNMCLDTNPEKRATLQQMQQHPWFTHTSSV